MIVLSIIVMLAQSDGVGPIEIPEQDLAFCGYVIENNAVRKRFWRVYKHSDLIRQNADKCPSEAAASPEEIERARQSLPYRH